MRDQESCPRYKQFLSETGDTEQNRLVLLYIVGYIQTPPLIQQHCWSSALSSSEKPFNPTNLFTDQGLPFGVHNLNFLFYYKFIPSITPLEKPDMTSNNSKQTNHVLLQWKVSVVLALLLWGLHWWWMYQNETTLFDGQSMVELTA